MRTKKDKNLFYFFILFLVIAFLSYSFSNYSSERNLSITAQAGEDFEAEIFSINLGARVDGSDSESVQRDVANIMSSLKSSLEEMNVKITSTNYHINPVFNYRDDYSEVRYRAYMNFFVEGEDLSLVGEVIDIASRKGSNSISGLRFDLSDNSREKYKDYLIEKAIKSAKAKADVAARASGSRVGKVLSIDMSQSSYMPYFRSAEANLDSTGSFENAIEPGLVSLNVNLDLVFELR
ncbi:MAG: SIMPL domain-containing protein [Candidatus Woesearchaeota archaeon]